MNDLVTLSGVPQTREEAERTASVMAREYAEAVASIRASLLSVKEQTDRLKDAFDVAGQPSCWNSFGIDVEADGQRHACTPESLDRLFVGFRRRAWRVLMDKLGVKAIMSIAERSKFEDQLERGELPEITERSIMDVVGGMGAQARGFAERAAAEVCEFLRPRSKRYATNSAFRVGKRVILTYMVERAWGTKYRVCYSKHQHLTALDAVFLLLDGKGVMRDPKGPLRTAIEESEDGTGETEMFVFKCCKNNNLHLTMKRLDLVKSLNQKATGEYVLGDDAA